MVASSAMFYGTVFARKVTAVSGMFYLECYICDEINSRAYRWKLQKSVGTLSVHSSFILDIELDDPVKKQSVSTSVQKPFKIGCQIYIMFSSFIYLQQIVIISRRTCK